MCAPILDYDASAVSCVHSNSSYFNTELVFFSMQPTRIRLLARTASRLSAPAAKPKAGMGYGYFNKPLRFPGLAPLWRYRQVQPWKFHLALHAYHIKFTFQMINSCRFHITSLLEREELAPFHADLQSLYAAIVDLDDHMKYIDKLQVYGGPSNNFTLHDRPNWEKESVIHDWRKAQEMVVPVTELVERLASNVALFETTSFRRLQHYSWKVRVFITHELVSHELWTYELPYK